MRIAPVIKLTKAEHRKLQRLSKAKSSAIRIKERSAMVRLAAEGLENQEIARRLQQDPGKVGRWRQRYFQHGLAGIVKDKTGPGRIKPISAAKRSRLLKRTLRTKPKGATHWSRQAMAKAVGVSNCLKSQGRSWDI